jgi:hypothetical protein
MQRLVAGQDSISGRIWAEAQGMTLEDGLESSGETGGTG